MKKTSESARKAVDNYQRKFDITQIRLDKGTLKRIEKLGLAKNKFINEVVTGELARLEMGAMPRFEKPEPIPKEIDGKPVYKYWNEDSYITDGQWWHNLVFFYDDMELNDLFIKVLDIDAEEHNNYANGCRLAYDFVNLARTKSKYGDDELWLMTDEEIDNLPDIDLEFDVTDKLKEHMRNYIYTDDKDGFLDFIGINEPMKTKEEVIQGVTGT